MRYIICKEGGITALVFSVEQFSVYDGPGIRTSVFLKGCPLRCQWCHNPEGQSFENQIIKSQSGCKNCGECVKDGTVDVNKCPGRLLRYCANEYTAGSLVEKISENLDICDGVTFSGGEPTAHFDFLYECLCLLRCKTNRALQTSGYCNVNNFKKLLTETDYVLYDLKLMDSALHKKYTGVDNRIILDNFEVLADSGVEFVIRVPLIPTVTDTEENLSATASLLKEHSIKYVELLPYNEFAGGKYKAVGMDFNPSYDETVKCEPHTEIFKKFGIEPKVL